MENTGLFTSHDGTQLFYRHWPSDTPSESALILLHRGHEHSGRLASLVDSLALKEFHAFAFDYRGHGKSPGARVDAPGVSLMVEDLDTFVQYISNHYDIPVTNILVIANSIGSIIACSWVLDYAPRIRGMVLAAPAFRIKLYAPFAIPALRLLLRFSPNAKVKSYVRPRLLTQDPEQAKAYVDDPLITKEISVRLLVDFYAVARRILKNTHSIMAPTLILTPEDDWVVRKNVQYGFYRNLSSPQKRFVRYPDFLHAIFHEKQRQIPIDEAQSFIHRCFAEEYEHEIHNQLLIADRIGPSRQSYDRLSTPDTGPDGWLKSAWYALNRSLLHSIGPWSNGIRIGLEQGFDSGHSLAYIYKNQPQGCNWIGRSIDRFYLQAPGWRGIRRRREQLVIFLDRVLNELQEKGQPVRILDIASGSARYLLDIVDLHPGLPLHIHLRDYHASNLKSAKDTFAKTGLADMTFHKADAYDKESLAAIHPRPNLVVVSGLYELETDNHKVLSSLRGVAAAIEPDGFLIYTSQPWHPQIEMIARLLNNHQQKPWVMRLRSQSEMDALVYEASFRKLNTMIGHSGIFNVSLAQRVS